MLRLEALSIGSAVPRPAFDGIAQSVFRRACNIRTGDGELLALLTNDLADSPHGIRVAAPAGFDFQTHIGAGRTVSCRAGITRVAGSELSIDLSSARRWRGDVSRFSVDLTRPQSARAWVVARNELDKRLLPNALPVQVTRVVPRLMEAVREQCLHQTVRAFAPMIGCGEGLTPAGDDVLVGYLVGLWSAVGRDRQRLMFLAALSGPIETATQLTNDISCAYLKQAAHGFAGSHIVALARQIAVGAAAARVRSATGSAMAAGASSGPAGVYGLLMGMAAWAPQAGRLKAETT